MSPEDYVWSHKNVFDRAMGLSKAGLGTFSWALERLMG